MIISIKYWIKWTILKGSANTKYLLSTKLLGLQNGNYANWKNHTNQIILLDAPHYAVMFHTINTDIHTCFHSVIMCEIILGEVTYLTVKRYLYKNLLELAGDKCRI